MLRPASEDFRTHLASLVPIHLAMRTAQDVTRRTTGRSTGSKDRSRRTKRISEPTESGKPEEETPPQLVQATQANLRHG